MEDDLDDDFTFPTTTVAATTVAEVVERDDVVDMTVATPAAVRLPSFPAPGGASSSRLWPFAALPIGDTTTAAAVKEEDEGPPAASTRRNEEGKEQERATVVDDEDRMDMVWDDGDTAASARSGGGRAAEAAHPAAAKQKQADDECAAAIAEQERMDLLWESFNEDLLLLRRARSTTTKAVRGVAPGPPDPGWYLCPSSSTTSDAKSEEVSSPPGRPRHGYGCAPPMTMLRASSRAGGAAQFCSASPRCPSRSRGGGWALLLRLFRRLFVVDDKAATRRRHGIYVP